MTRRNDMSLSGMTSRSGVYIISNLVTKKMYVGSAKSIRSRLVCHRNALRLNCHDNSYLQNSWNKYGERAFGFGCLEECNLEDCVEQEQHWIDLFDSANRDRGYNLNPKAGSCLGMKHSPESRLKMSISQRGNKGRVLATIAAAIANKGRERPLEIRVKISVAQKGRKKSKAHKAKIKITHWTKTKSEQEKAEIIARMVAKNVGRKHTKEHKEKIGASHWVNGPNAELVRAKVSAAGKGQKRTPEQRRNISEARKKAWALKKAALVGSTGRVRF